MIGRRTAVGLSLLCALLFSAIAVQSASAATKAVNTTAFTCVKGKGNLDFKDVHCDEKVAEGTGEYGHVVIAKDTTTKFEGEKVTNAVLKSKAAGAAVEVTCTVVEATGELHNVETPTNKHTVTGTLTTTFKTCTVNKPTKGCVVEEPIVTKTEFEGVEEIQGAKEKEEEKVKKEPVKGTEMGVEHKPDGGGETFVKLNFKDKNKGVEECSIEGEFPVNGTAVQTGAVAPTKANKHTGTTGIFTDAMTTETLKFGPEKAGFEVSTTVRMDPKENGIALTTVT